jgi:hypothetical protein
MTTKIGPKTFSGAGSIHDGTLATAMRAMAQRLALGLAVGVSDFTADNSGGTDGTGTIGAIALPAGFTSVGTDLSPKAGLETALGTVRNAISTVLAQANLVAAATGADAAVDNTGGTSGAGTIAAVTVATTAVTGASGNGAAATGTIEVLTNTRNALAQLAQYVNTLCVATGQTKLVDNSGGDAGTAGKTFAALSTDTGTATPDGASLSGIEDTAGEAFLTGCANAIATIAAKLDAITGGTVGAPQVVAVE